MGKINVARVLLGGLVAGLVLNIGEYILDNLVLAGQWATFVAETGRGAFGAGQIAAFIVLTFLFGIALIWIYAAIRPRFGPGPRTAVIAGLTLWAVVWLLVSASFAIGGLVPAKLAAITVAWGLFEAPAAAVAGAWFYREGDGA